MTDQNIQYEEDIEKIIKYLQIYQPDRATRQDAIDMYETMQANAHLTAHEIVEAEISGKIDKVKLDK